MRLTYSDALECGAGAGAGAWHLLEMLDMSETLRPRLARVVLVLSRVLNAPDV